MALAHVFSAVISGMTGAVVTVEVDVSQGLPAVGLVGLADAAIGEARHRARCAVGNSGCTWPLGKVTIGLSPAHVRKHGTGLDLPIAIGVLAADEQIALPAGTENRAVIIGELGLDGRVRAVPGAITVTCAAKQAGFSRVIVPVEHVAECSRVPGMEVIGVDSLAMAVRVLAGKEDGVCASAPVSHATSTELDLADVVEQWEGRRAVEIAATGRHSVAMIGPPGVGKTLLAERLPGLLPDLPSSEAVDVMAIHALVAAGGERVPGEDARPPFQSPHHSTSPAALLGSVSGGSVRPGAVSLAHRGVLFLDEAPEFARNSLEALRQPLESGVVSLHRAGWSGEVPADFQLILAANPCPCGYRDAPKDMQRRCSCSRVAVAAYAQRISGPLLDRIDLRVRLHPVRGSKRGESTSEVAERVAAARDRAVHRWGISNAHVPGHALAEHDMDASAYRVLDDHLRTSGGMRASHRITRVAWTLADLAGSPRPGGEHVREAVEWHQPLWQQAS